MANYVKHIVTDFSVPTNGTSDCSTAWAAITTFLSGLSAGDLVKLIVPNHTYVFDSGGSGIALLTGALGGLRVIVDAPDGATFTDGGGGSGFFYANAGLVSDNLHSSRIETAGVGATTLVLKTASEHSRYSIDRWIAVTHGDTQGYGSPANPMQFKYHRITGKNAGLGTIDITPPLTKTYLSTLPLFNPGVDHPAPDSLDCGGPATIYALPVGWDLDATFNNITSNQASQQYFVGRKATFNGGGVTSSAGLTPTLNQEITFSNFDQSACSIEVDKMIEILRYNNCSANQLTFQSMSCATHCYVTNSVITTYNGTPQNLVIEGGSTASLQIGVTSYGVTETVTVNNCAIADLSANAVNVSGIIAAGYTMSGGVIRVPDAEGPPTWAVPGAKCFFKGTKTNQDSGFRVLSVTQDATHTIVTTTATGGFPNVPGTLGIVVHPCWIWNGTGNTGCRAAVDLSQAGAQNKPLFSYSKRTYTKANLLSSASFDLWGQLVAININVTTAYTGTNNPMTAEFVDNMLTPTRTAVSAYDPILNLRQGGTRSITKTLVSSQSGDTFGAAPGAIWFGGHQDIFPSADVSGETAGPVVEVEMITDQAVPNDRSFSCQLQ